MKASFEKDLLQILSNHQTKRQQQRQQHPQRSDAIVDKINHLVKQSYSQNVSNKQLNQQTTEKNIDRKLLLNMYQKAVEICGNKIDKQAKYLAPRVLQNLEDVVMVGNQNSISTISHDDDDDMQQQEEEEEVKEEDIRKNAAIVTVSELNFGLNDTRQKDLSTKMGMPTITTNEFTGASSTGGGGDDIPSPINLHLQGTEEKNNPKPSTLSSSDSCSSSTSTITMSSNLDDDTPSSNDSPNHHQDIKEGLGIPVAMG